MLRAKTTGTERARAQLADIQRAHTQRAPHPTSNKRPFSEDTPTENTPAQRTPTQNSASQNTPTQDAAPSQDAAPTQENATEFIYTQSLRFGPSPPLVSQYVQDPQHPPPLRYPVGSPENVFHFARFNLDGLLTMASKLRDNQPCECPRDVPPASDSRNWSLPITFKDGVQWIFQVPHPHGPLIQPNYSTTPDPLVKSEVSTLKYLTNVPTVPVPRVRAWSPIEANEIGVPYILMDKPPGRSLSQYEWVEPCHRPPRTSQIPRHLRPISDANKAKVMEQLGPMISGLAYHRFEHIGSLITDDFGFSVVDCLAPGVIWNGRDRTLRPRRGPFSTEDEYFDGLITGYREQAHRLNMDTQDFFSPRPDRADFRNWDDFFKAMQGWFDFATDNAKTNNSRSRLWHITSATMLRSMVPNLTRERTVEEGLGYPLCHPDLQFDNIYVDDDFKITCISGWTSASTAPLADLLVTPYSRDELFRMPADLEQAFRDSFEASFDRGKLPTTLWRRVDLITHFQRLIRLNTFQSWKGFKVLYRELYRDGPNLRPVAEIQSLLSAIEAARPLETYNLTFDLDHQLFSDPRSPKSDVKLPFSAADTEKWLETVEVPPAEYLAEQQRLEDERARRCEAGLEGKDDANKVANANDDFSPPIPARLDTASPDLYSADDIVMTSSPVAQRSTSQGTAMTALTASAADERHQVSPPLPSPPMPNETKGKGKGKAMSPMEIDFIRG